MYNKYSRLTEIHRQQACTGGGGRRQWRCRWWCLRAVVGVSGGGGGGGSVAGGQPARGGPTCGVRGGPRVFFVLENLLCREPYGALGTSVTRVFTLALGKEPFVGPAVPSGLCREFPLGTGCVECIPACAESNSLSANPWIPEV
jgi:hypothetical protein